ncbi:MAG: hypothetical protein KF901_03425 [Myxococcales bacterium]|nr:hypothetical protein [Myxococcales bacterium]
MSDVHGASIPRARAARAAERKPRARWRERGQLTLLATLALLLAACSDPACPDGTVRDPSAPEGSAARCLEADAGPDAPDTSPDAPPPDAGPCNGLCAPDLCLDDTCVECSPTTPCTEGVCTAEGACVTCTQDAHCTSPDAARCDLDTNECAPCEASPECEGVTAGDRPLGICDDGTCVECVPGEHGPCGAGRLCNGQTRGCEEAEAGSRAECQRCIADAECIEGTVCVSPGQYGETGHFCLPRREEFCARPFVAVANEQTSIDGATVDYCRHRNTSCAGFNHFSSAVPGCMTATDGAVVGGVAPGDGSCGLPGTTDNTRCRVGGAGARCTYQCSSSDDCREGHTCTMGVASFCSL